MERTQQSETKRRAEKLPARYINTYREIASGFMRVNVDLVINGRVADRFVSEGYSHERVIETSSKLAKQAKRAFVPTGKILDYGEVSLDRFQLLAAR